MNKFMTKEQYARIKKENGLVSYDGANLKDADGNTIEVGGGGLTKEKLWENASPTSNFSSQAIEIEGIYDYKLLIINFWSEASYGSNIGFKTVIVDLEEMKKNNIRIPAFNVAIINDLAGIYTREVVVGSTLVENSQIKFEGGYTRMYSTISTRNSSSSVVIPFTIYGLK